MKLYDPHWEYLMVTISIAVFIAGGVIFFFLIPEPHMAGIVIDEYQDEKDVIADSISHDSEIRKSIRHSQSAE
jgi:hypothetical protein